MSIQVKIIQHASFESAGAILDWAADRAIPVSVCHAYKHEPLPDLNYSDILVVLGGPMSVGDEEQYPWLRAEKILLKAAIAKGNSILGICLGAQLLAESLGASVFPAKHKEIGWFSVESVANRIHGEQSIAKVLGNLTSPTFHWHGDTYSLPASAERILTREGGCLEQGFVAGPRQQIIGLQCHIEMATKGILAMLEHGKADLQQPGPFVMTHEQIEKDLAVRVVPNIQICFRMMDYLARRTTEK